MSWCHQSQIREWLPWVGRHGLAAPASPAEWRKTLRGRFHRQQRELGVSRRRAAEVFTVTAWGEVPGYQQIVADFPGRVAAPANLRRLRRRLALWRRR